ncbi:MAG: hypothetical protein IPL79_08795 [Myxococcales bacterium]|nr:hypothetical protein [Myxococcales bacterium]
MLLLALAGCTGAADDIERESNALGATCSIPAMSAGPASSAASTATPDVQPGGGEAYGDILGQGLGANCSENFTNINHCANRDNPPAPSIDRSLSTTLFGYQDGKAAGYPEEGGEHGTAGHENYRPAAGDAQIMPFARSSNDARLLLDGSYGGWPKLALLRPENVGYDLTVASASQTPLSREVAELHGLTWFNPIDTSYVVDGADPEVWNLISSAPNTLHSTMCENSSDQTDTEHRSPYACKASYGAVAYGRLDAPAGEHIGLCYDFTLVSGVARTERKSGPMPAHWELRSAPVTVFVRTPYTTSAGEPIGDGLPHSWVYPQRASRGLVPNDEGVVTMPDFAPYDIGYLFPWNQFGSGSVDLKRLALGPSVAVQRDGGVVDVPTDCYLAPGAPNEEGEPWCAFLWDQRRSSEFYLDLDQNGVVEADKSKLTSWDGRGKYTLFEATTEGTGRLLMINFNAGLLYSVQSTTTPCAADGFSVWRPLSSMPIDPAAAEFPLAGSTGGQPFRDPSGAAMPFGSLHRFAYQWLDRAGKHLILAMMNEQRDAYKPTAIERVFVRGQDVGRPNPPASAETDEVERNRMGLNSRAGHELAVIGAWTGGKFVTLDNGLNLSDFGGRGTFGPDGNFYTHKYTLDLYRDKSIAFIPKGVSGVQSPEHRLGLFDALRPTMPFDVVWAVSSNNHRNSEIVFDDYHAKNALVVAHMNAPMTFKYNTSSGGSARPADPVLLDGFVATGDPASTTPGYKLGKGDAVVRARLQNAAGNSPVSSLRLLGGARVEPVALGGVLGKGVYLDGHNDFIDIGGYYGTQMPRDYYAGIWVDLRDVEKEPKDRVLFYFADDSYIGFAKDGASWKLTAHSGSARKSLALGALLKSNAYHHVGVMSYMEGGSRVLEILIDGNRIGTLTFAGDKFSLQATHVGSASRLTIGSPYKQTRSFWDWLFGRVGRRGALGAWVDEFRLYRLDSGEMSPDSYFAEVACNQALGTLVLAQGELPAALTGKVSALRDATGETPARLCEQLQFTSHGDPTDLPRQVGRGAICVDKVHRNANDPRCLRGQLHQLPTPVAELARVDEQENKFCTSCHVEAPRAAKGLGMNALVEGDVARWLDRRRQPMNPPATLALPGNICAPDAPLRDTWYGLFATWGQSPAPSVFATDFVTDGQIPVADGGVLPQYMPPFVGSAAP